MQKGGSRCTFTNLQTIVLFQKWQSEVHCRQRKSTEIYLKSCIQNKFWMRGFVSPYMLWLCNKKGKLPDWSDFLTMSTCAISNQADQKHRAEREKIYMNTVRKYSKDDTFRIKDMLWLEPTCYKTGGIFFAWSAKNWVCPTNISNSTIHRTKSAVW